MSIIEKLAGIKKKKCDHCGGDIDRESSTAGPNLCCYEGHSLCDRCWKTFAQVLGEDEQEFVGDDEFEDFAIQSALGDFYVTDQEFSWEARRCGGCCRFCTNYIRLRIPTNAELLEMLHRSGEDAGSEFDLAYYNEKYSGLEFAVACECAKQGIDKCIAVLMFKEELCKKSVECWNKTLAELEEAAKISKMDWRKEFQKKVGFDKSAEELYRRTKELVEKYARKIKAEKEKMKCHAEKVKKARAEFIKEVEKMDRKEEEEDGEPASKKKKVEEDD